MKRCPGCRRAAVQGADDVAGALGVNGRGLGFFGLGGPAGARIDSAPSVQGPAADLAQTGNEAGRIEDLRHLLPPGQGIESGLEIRDERRSFGGAQQPDSGHESGQGTERMTDGIGFAVDQVLMIACRGAFRAVAGTVDGNRQ